LSKEKQIAGRREKEVILILFQKASVQVYYIFPLQS